MDWRVKEPHFHAVENLGEIQLNNARVTPRCTHLTSLGQGWPRWVGAVCCRTEWKAVLHSWCLFHREEATSVFSGLFFITSPCSQGTSIHFGQGLRKCSFFTFTHGKRISIHASASMFSLWTNLTGYPWRFGLYGGSKTGIKPFIWEYIDSVFNLGRIYRIFFC